MFKDWLLKFTLRAPSSNLMELPSGTCNFTVVIVTSSVGTNHKEILKEEEDIKQLSAVA